MDQGFAALDWPLSPCRDEARRDGVHRVHGFSREPQRWSATGVWPSQDVNSKSEMWSTKPSTRSVLTWPRSPSAACVTPRVLADRSEFVLRDDHTAGWDRINETPARGLLAPLSLALEHWSLPAVEKWTVCWHCLCS